MDILGISSKTMMDDSTFGDRPPRPNFLMGWWIKIHSKKRHGKIG
jgi:hypothetical protein